MTLSFLGTASGHPSAHRYHATTLVLGEEGGLLLDCGTNVSMFLKQKGLNAEVIDGIWLSHAHSDHIGGFSNFIQALWLQKRKKPLSLFAPEILIRILQQELEQRLLAPNLLGFELKWESIQDKKLLKCQALSLQGFATRHLSALEKKIGPRSTEICYQCYGLIWEMEGQRWVYSSDLASPDDLKGIWEKPVGGLICELAHYSPESLFHFLKEKPLKWLWLNHYGDEWVGQASALQTLAQKIGLTAKVYLMKDGESLVL